LAHVKQQERTFREYSFLKEIMFLKPNILDKDCSARRALDLIADKWAVLIIYALSDGPKRYNQLRRIIQGTTPKMLTQTLRRLETNGLISRMVIPARPPMVEYALTPLGETLMIPLTALCHWAEAHALEINAVNQQVPFLLEQAQSLSILKHI
jgi:DNA-binding HxlR family transcriptional regulator